MPGPGWQPRGTRMPVEGRRPSWHGAHSMPFDGRIHRGTSRRPGPTSVGGWSARARRTTHLGSGRDHRDGSSAAALPGARPMRRPQPPLGPGGRLVGWASRLDDDHAPGVKLPAVDAYCTIAGWRVCTADAPRYVLYYRPVISMIELGVGGRRWRVAGPGRRLFHAAERRLQRPSVYSSFLD